MTNYNRTPENAQVAEVKENLSRYIAKVQEGKVITIIKGKKHEPVAQLVPIQKPEKRKVLWGSLRGNQPTDMQEFSEEELDEFLNEPVFPE